MLSSDYLIIIINIDMKAKYVNDFDDADTDGRFSMMDDV
jgi:hypothetical protein